MMMIIIGVTWSWLYNIIICIIHCCYCGDENAHDNDDNDDNDGSEENVLGKICPHMISGRETSTTGKRTKGGRDGEMTWAW